jgi:hypothetical protein
LLAAVGGELVLLGVGGGTVRHAWAVGRRLRVLPWSVGLPAGRLARAGWGLVGVPRRLLLVVWLPVGAWWGAVGLRLGVVVRLGRRRRAAVRVTAVRGRGRVVVPVGPLLGLIAPAVRREVL